MESFIRIVGPNRAVEIFGIRLVGVNAENGMKLLFSLLLIALVMLINRMLLRLARGVTQRGERIAFWSRQAIHLATFVILLFGIASIWFDDPTRLATAMGLITAGLAFALQRVVTAMAGYVIILRGKTFNVGDRIVMGGVRGDVIALGFMQTTIMEMGQPPPVQNADPAMWVKARQYTGRIVTVSNAKIFDEPIYNYTREFPYLWEEMTVGVPYTADRDAAERILMDGAQQLTISIAQLSEPEIQELQRRYAIKRSDIQPRVYWRMTDNWLEMTVRFIAADHGARDLKDTLTRHILASFDQAGIPIASATFELTGLPEVRLRRSDRRPAPTGSKP